jgi:NADH-quinone oxidoreductase subunit E
MLKLEIIDLRMGKDDTISDIGFSEDALNRIRELMRHYPDGRQKSALIPALHIAQEENNGWLSTGVMDKVAEILQITPVEVYEAATFYTQFNLEPVGKHVLEICRTGPCCLEGAEKVISFVENRLGIKDGETTPDGLFTLKTVECLGACGYGPVVQVGDHYHEHLSEQKMEQLLEELKDKH